MEGDDNRGDRIPDMQGKKLLTAACALGILISGACFLPPARPTLPLPPAGPAIPPPAVQAVDLHGSRRVRIEVANASPTQHIDESIAFSELIKILGQRERGSRISAEAVGKSRPGDAVLEITILHESAIMVPPPAKPNVTDWRIKVAVDATLTAGDGAVVWFRSNAEYTIDYRDLSARTEEPWDEPEFKDQAYFRIFDPLVPQMENAY